MKTLAKPHRLLPGDKVQIVSPSWQGGREFTDRALQGAAHCAAQTGLEIVLDKENLFTGMDRFT